MKEEKIEPVFFKGKKIGDIYHDRDVYVSPRNRLHIFRKFGDGFGNSEKLLDYLQQCGISTIIINYENREGFVATVDDFICKGEDWDDDGDKQIILSKKYWRKEIKQEHQEKL